ncbi:MAG: hypothetical protein AAF236_09300 [Verrucomicrobiota bacterium]
MSFSFRNLFTQEGEAPGSELEEATEKQGSPGAARSESVLGTGEASPGTPYLVSELLPFIPPAIAAEKGIPMDKEVRIELPEDGSNDVRLSTIYAECPELFEAEITPMNDSVVMLPAKLGAISTPAAKPFTQSSAFSAPDPSAESDAIAGQTDLAVAEEETTPARSPWGDRLGKDTNAFGEPFPDAEMDVSNNPFLENKIESEEQPPELGSGNDAGEKPKAKNETPPPEPNFSKPKSESSGAGAPRMDEPKMSQNPFDSDESFQTLFSEKADDDAALPFPGEGESGSSGSWEPMFQTDTDQESIESKSDSEPQIDSIGNLLRQKKQESEISHDGDGEAPESAGEQRGGSTDGFMGPGEPESQADLTLETRSDEPEAADSDTHHSPAFLQSGQFASDAKIGPIGQALSSEAMPEFKTEASGAENQKSEAAPASEVETEAPEMQPSPVASSENSKPTEPLIPSTSDQSLRAETSEVRPRAVVNVQPAQPGSQSEAVANEPSSRSIVDQAAAVSSSMAQPGPPIREESHAAAPAAAVPSPGPMSTPPNSLGFGASSEEDERDLELRALFSTSERFTLSILARRVVELPGVESCAILTPARTVEAARGEGARLGEDAREMQATIHNLARLTGVPDAHTFTVHSMGGVVSFFLEEKCCLAVRQAGIEFEPGVREKLTLIARCLQKLED